MIQSVHFQTGMVVISFWVSRITARFWESRQTAQDTIQDSEDKRAALVEYCTEPRSKQEMMRFLGLANTSHFRKAYLAPLLDAGRIVMTIPDKSASRNQRYKKK